jgi:acetyl esterase/lipase
MASVGSAVLVAATLPGSVLAQDPGYPPEIAGARVEMFKTVDGVALDAWILVPDGHRPSDARPAMVFFFGGGWVRGTPAHFERQARVLTELGMVAVLADYRVLSRHDAGPASGVEDAKSAVRWLRSHAAELGIDANRIGAGGGSSGGHLAASTGTLPGLDAPGEDASVSSVPDAVVLFNPGVIIAPIPGVFELDEQLAARVRGPLLDISPYHHLSSDTPPTLILHGADDELIPLASVEAYCERAVELGSPCEVVSYEGAGHGFFNRDPFYEPTVAEMVRFLTELGWVEGREP